MTNHQGNASQNHNEIKHHMPTRIAYYQKEQITTAGKDMEKPGESPWHKRSLVGSQSPWGHKESVTTEQLRTQHSKQCTLTYCWWELYISAAIVKNSTGPLKN